MPGTERTCKPELDNCANKLDEARTLKLAELHTLADRVTSPAEQLAELRATSGLSLSEVGRILGVRPHTVSRWLSPPGAKEHRTCPAWAPRLLELELQERNDDD